MGVGGPFCNNYRKNLKIWTHKKIYSNQPKNWKYAEGISNSVDPDQKQSDLGLHYVPRPTCPKI